MSLAPLQIIKSFFTGLMEVVLLFTLILEEVRAML